LSPPRVLGVIPARGGSKRVPNKNLRPLHNSPLIAYTIRAAQASELLTTWVVSTENQTIANVALSFGAYVVKRPEELAEDDATTGNVLVHALEWMGADEFDLVVCLHPTSPARDPRHIDQAINQLWQSDAPALASVSCRKRTYTHNASLYVMRTDFLLKTKSHYGDESIPFLMDRRHSLDIDTEDDLKIAELFLQERD
jgi:CMP-N,N'-diacetyllegionaminic acid synthase